MQAVIQAAHALRRPVTEITAEDVESCHFSARDSLTLVFMMLGIGMLIPVTIAYNAYQYAVFCEKITATALRVR
jgi:hypothetical protein